MGVGLDDARWHAAYFAELGPAGLSEAFEEDMGDSLVEEAETFAAEFEDVGAEFAQLTIGDAGGVGGVDENEAIARVDVTSVDDGDGEGVGVAGVRVEFGDGVAEELSIENGIDEATCGGHVFEVFGSLDVGVAGLVDECELGAEDLGLAELDLGREVSVVHDVVEEFLELGESRGIDAERGLFGTLPVGDILTVDAGSAAVDDGGNEFLARGGHGRLDILFRHD